MVHQTMPTIKTSASSASSKIRPMRQFPFLSVRRACAAGVLAWIVGSQLGCTVAPVRENPAPERVISAPPEQPALTPQTPQAVAGLPAVIVQAQSRWVPVPWSDLPGLDNDAVQEAWPAWLHSCARPSKAWLALCAELSKLAQADVHTQRQWLREKLQPYRVESLAGSSTGLLTAYYEPVLQASRLARAGFEVPLYAAPDALRQKPLWYTRQEIDTLPQARAALRGKALVYLNNPVDALVLQIQGSGLIQVTEPDGRQRLTRLAFGGTNGHPYKSVGRWLLDQNLVRDATWPGIKAWTENNPARVTEMLWQNPRVVFFKEEVLSQTVLPPGPKGAQGVPLTAERSIAVDRTSIPYGTPVWLKSPGPQAVLDRLVLAQDTGAAIVGAVRADFYAGSGVAAGELAGRLKQPLHMWVLWPR